MGAGNHPKARKGQKRGPRRRERGHHGRHQDPHAGRAYHDGGTSAAPPPADAARPQGTHAPNTRRRSTNRTPYGSHRHTPTSHQKPHRRWRAHLHGENGLQPQRKPLGTPPRSPPPRPHNQATTPATTRATSQALEEDEGTATAPRARARDLQRTRDQGTGPPERATPRTPTRPTSPSGTPRPPQHGPSEPPTPNRTPQPPANHTPTRTPHHDTGQADLHRTTTEQHRSAPQCNALRQGTPKHNTPQHDATRRSTERHTTARHGATRRTTAHHSTKARDANRRTNQNKPPHTLEGTAPARHTPARGHRAPGNNGGGPGTQTPAS